MVGLIHHYIRYVLEADLLISEDYIFVKLTFVMLFYSHKSSA